MIRKATEKDRPVIAELVDLLWPGAEPEEQAVFFIKYEKNQPVGFAQLQFRTDYVEGCEASPVGYLEGIFVQEGSRRRGYARELLAACEAYAKEQGCTEFASDCELDNTESLQFHLAVGFSEINRNIHFKKEL